MLAVAVDRVKEEGLLLDYTNIELEDLIRTAGVPRSTVFRIWPDRVAFVADLVRALFEADPGFDKGFDGETLRRLEEAVAGDPQVMSTPEGRQVALREALRITVSHNMTAVEHTVAFRAYRAMSAALSSMAMVDGMSDHRRINPAMVDAPRVTALGPEGPRDWHLAGIAVYGIYTAYTEAVEE